MHVSEAEKAGSCLKREATVGFEPTNNGFAIHRLSHLATSPLSAQPRERLMISQDRQFFCSGESASYDGSIVRPTPTT